MNAKAMLQIIGRLIRIGQTKKVEFLLIKVKDSYHDNIERIMLSNEMGYRIRHLGLNQVEKLNKGEKVVFKPHLLLTPVAPITQVYNEINEQFPDFNVLVYYGVPGQFPQDKATVVECEELRAKLKALDPEDPKVSLS